MQQPHFDGRPQPTQTTSLSSSLTLSKNLHQGLLTHLLLTFSDQNSVCMFCFPHVLALLTQGSVFCMLIGRYNG